MRCEAAAKPKPDVEGRSEKSAEAVVAGASLMGSKSTAKGPSREGVLIDMSMPKALRQMHAPAGRAGAARGEAVREPVSDEAEARDMNRTTQATTTSRFYTLRSS